MRHPFLRTLAGSAATPTDPNFENVTLLLHGDGTNGGQNNTFVDGSTNNFTITRNGNTTQGTFSPYGDNWSNYFDGTGDYLTVPDNAAFDFGTGDFTIECWVYIAGNSSPDGGGNRTAGLFSAYAASGVVSRGYTFEIEGNASTTGTGLSFYNNNSGTQISLIATTTISQGTWHHVAVCRSGTTTRLFLNGSSVASGTLSNQNVNSDYSITIGRLGYASYLQEFNGYISNLRVLKGTAQYTGSYTVPTAPLTAITNTSLLTCQSNRFRDASTNNFTITRNGDVSVQRFSPFSPTAAYAAGTIGGSGYFDGTGDFLTYPTGQTPMLLGTSDWTFEAWVYRLSNTNTAAIFGGQSDLTTAAGSAFGFYVSSSVTSDVFQGSTTRSVTSPNPTIGQWAHVAWVRTGGTFSSYLNGTRVGTVGTLGTTAINNGATTYPGFVGAFATGANPFSGYISGARLIKGSGGYDATSATITVPTSPPTAITNTSLLLNFTNAAVLDNAMMAVPETVGNAQIDTTTKKYGTGSMKFDGTGDYLVLPNTVNLAFGTGNFTVEAWIYIAGNSNLNGSNLRIAAVVSSTSGAVQTGFEFTIYGDATTTGTGLNFTNWVSSTPYSINNTSTSISQSAWHHVAAVRNGTTTTLYLDGTSIASGTLGNQTINPGNNLWVGANNSTNYFHYLNGYIDDLRITKGVARYTSNFTAPTAAFPDL